MQNLKAKTDFKGLIKIVEIKYLQPFVNLIKRFGCLNIRPKSMKGKDGSQARGFLINE